jgi:hypothetical protein
MFFEMKFATFKTVGALRAAAHETLAYIAKRVGRNGEDMERLLFGWETIDRQDAEQFIDTLDAKPLRFWRVIVSPDPNSEKENLQKDLDLWELTRKVMGYIRDHIDPTIEFIVAEHNDHTDIPHVQGLVFFKGRLNKYDLNRMRHIAIAQALAQRRVRDLTHTHQLKLTKALRQTGARTHTATLQPLSGPHSGMAGGRVRKRGREALLVKEHAPGRRGARGGRRRKQTISCEQCAYKNPMVRLKDGSYYCLTCGRLKEAAPKLRLSQEHESRL